MQLARGIVIPPRKFRFDGKNEPLRPNNAIVSGGNANCSRPAWPDRVRNWVRRNDGLGALKFALEQRLVVNVPTALNADLDKDFLGGEMSPNKTNHLLTVYGIVFQGEIIKVDH